MRMSAKTYVEVRFALMAQARKYFKLRHEVKTERFYLLATRQVRDAAEAYREITKEFYHG